MQFVSHAEMVDMDDATGPTRIIGKDQSVVVSSPECSVAFGSYTVDGTWTITFDIDASSLACEADSQAGQFVQYLIDAVKWHFDNGQLIIELSTDGGSPIFAYVEPE